MVKDGSALERLARVDRALLDKTGTLTLGKPVPDPVALDALPVEEAQVALALASHSRHPFSRALGDALAAKGFVPSQLDAIREEPGEGMFAHWLGLKVALRRPETGAASAVALSIEGRPVRVIHLADRLRPGVDVALARLRSMGIECSILSGDGEQAVAEVARATCLFAQAEVRPAQKQEIVSTLRALGRNVLMVGDGLNDGPALAAADASMAPGTASEVGLQAADMVFVQASLLALPRAVAASRRTMAVVKQNFVLAIGYNVLAVPLAMAGMVTPLIAAAAMSISSLIVIANSLRLVRAAR